MNSSRANAFSAFQRRTRSGEFRRYPRRAEALNGGWLLSIIALLDS